MLEIQRLFNWHSNISILKRVNLAVHLITCRSLMGLHALIEISGNIATKCQMNWSVVETRWEFSFTVMREVITEDLLLDGQHKMHQSGQRLSWGQPKIVSFTVHLFWWRLRECHRCSIIMLLCYRDMLQFLCILTKQHIWKYAMAWLNVLIFTSFSHCSYINLTWRSLRIKIEYF